MFPPKKKVTLTDAQKHEFCLYANNYKKTWVQYVEWIRERWGIVIDQTTVTRILQTKDKRLSIEVTYPEKKHHKSVTFLELELALKEFVLNYQHRAILSDTILIEKAKLLADGLGIPENGLQFSSEWLQGFKKRNGIRQQKFQGEAGSADQTAILEALPVLHTKCADYPLKRIYNMDEMGFFISMYSISKWCLTNII